MTNIERTRELCDALREWDSPTVSNAIELLECRDRTLGFASAEVCCQFPELEPMVGYAVTCTIDSSTPGGQRPSRIGDLIERLESAPKPSVVVAQHKGPDRMRSCFVGDMVSTLFHLLGAAGAVSDTPSRDIASIQGRAPGFQLFGPGVISSHGNGAILEIDVPVMIGGMSIEPGDLVHGDLNGLISVPIGMAQEAVALCAQVRADEQEIFDLMDTEPLPVAELKTRFTH
mgnify:FL=1